MTFKPLHLLLLATSMLMAGVLVWRFSAPGMPIPTAGAIGDPLADYLTRTHATAYGGIDRWAFYGMKAEALAARLGAEGYACTLPQAPVGQPRLTGIHAAICTRQLRWPLARTLTINAQIDYDQRARLVAANASSTGSDGLPLRQRLAVMLREAGWLEPATLQVSGIRIDTADTLARYAVDALSPQGWHALCGDDSNAGGCAHMASERRQRGLPPLPRVPVASGEAMSIAAALDRVRLLPMVVRGPDQLPPDSLLVRMENKLLWLDFIGRDLAGRSSLVSVGLTSDGGTPVTLVARVGRDSKSLSLGGTPRMSGNGARAHLVPLALPGPAQPATWFYLHQRPSEAQLGTLAQTLPLVDPRFLPTVLQDVIGTIAAPSTADDILGLYRPLTMVESRAGALRAMHAAEWLGRAQAAQLIKTAYADDKITRAAWAMSACEPGPQARPPAPACWADFAGADPEAAGMLRTELATLQLVYSGLDPAHPLRLHLLKLGQALAVAPLPQSDWDRD